MTSPIPGVILSDITNAAATPDDSRRLPATRRILKADGIDLISFTFSPGQVLGDHQAAYPITVQCVAGEVDFIIGEHTIPMKEGTLLHLDEGIMHHVKSPTDSPGTSTILVSLLTGERKHNT